MLKASDLQHVLVTEYQPGAAIGWHKDRSVFGDVVGISLMSPCTFRWRRKAGVGWQRAAITLGRRSAIFFAVRRGWSGSTAFPQ